MPGLTPYQIDALDYSSNILLTANAGSGKTYVLSKRFVEIVLKENIELENVVAITFTEKAAGELNKRIAVEIDSRIANEDNVQILRKLESIRRQLVSANISTIHSFCINILKEFAPEAGIDVNYSPIDKFTSDELIELSINDAVNFLINNEQYESKIKYLIRFFGSKKILINHLKTSVEQRRTIEGHLSGLYSKSEKEIAQVFSEKFETYFHDLFDSQIVEAVKSAEVINNAVLAQPKGNETAVEIAALLKSYSSHKSLIEILDFLKKIGGMLLTKQGKIKSRGYMSRERDSFQNDIELIESVFSSINPFYEIEKPDDSHIELAKFGKNFIEVYTYIANLYSGKKRQKGYLDFEDILLHTQKIIQLEEVRLFLSNKYKYIMIDEYQDTDEIQYKIFMPILDYLKHGNLFVVGDEKQSIYMFRDADLRIFNQTKSDISGNLPAGKLLDLPHSFRMAPQLVLFTNKLFSSLFSDPERIFNEVEYKELVCAKSEEEKSVVEFLLADKKDNITEAELVADKILELISQKEVELKEIGILCRKRNLFEELENEFVKRSIPYTIIGGKGFYQRQSIYDIYNYLSFLLNENDDAALVGILRSPFFNLSDLELFQISLEEGKSFFEKLTNRAAHENNLLNIVNQLKENKLLAFGTEVFTLIRTLLLQSGYWSVLASQINSKQELANLDKLLRIARSFSQKSFKSLYDFTVTLRNSIETMTDEGQAQVARDENTVKLLTIHQSKGLEFKTVFVYGCNGSAYEDSVKSKGLSIDKEFGFLTKVPIDGKYFSEYSSAPVTAMFNYISHKKNVAEVKRLMYVAITRAMNHLYISVSHEDYKPKKDSFFQYMCEGLNPDFTKGELKLNDSVRFMLSENDKYKFYNKNVNLEIKFNNRIETTADIKLENNKQISAQKYLIDEIKDVPNKEIISATKISMFTQCPVKYELTYDLGYSTILDLIKSNKNTFEFNSKEDDELRKYADVKGKIIHSILKDDFSESELELKTDKYLVNEAINNPNIVTGLKKNIINDIEKLIKSKTYADLNKYDKYGNEIEIYCEEGEHYLYGIIDKLIYDGDRLIIVDYKTDDITDEQLNYRAKAYFPQLQFYSYILSKLYPDTMNFELRLLFIKLPDDFVVKTLHKEDMINYKIGLNSAINKIMLREFIPNLEHCSKCNFALDGNKCVKLFS